MFQQVLLPTDGSKMSLQAIDAVTNLAQQQPTLRVTVAVVYSPLKGDETDYRTEYLGPHNTWLRQQAQAAAERAVAKLQPSGIQCTIKILEGKPVSALLANEAANGGYDLIVMSSRGLSREEDRLRYLGSVTEHVIRRASVPVLVVPVSDND